MTKMVLIPFDQFIRSDPTKSEPSQHCAMDNEELDQKRLSKELILEPFSKTQLKSANSLLAYVERNMDWNDQGEIIIDGEVIIGSHVKNLLKDALFNYKNFEPLGFRAFYHQLSNITTSLIRNPSRRSLIGRGGPPPPGIPVGRKSIDISKHTNSNWRTHWKPL